MVTVIDKAIEDGKIVTLAEPVVVIRSKDGQIMTIPESEATNIGIELHREYYSEPTYDELEDKVAALESRVEELEYELEGYREEPIRYVAVRI